MQTNHSPRFVKRFMIGLIASGAGAFVALPGSAIPEPTAEETLPVANAVEEAIDEAEAAVEDAIDTADDAVEEAAADTDDAVEASEDVATEERDTTEFTIVELTDLNDSFQVLSAALEAADLSEVLSSEGPFTVFAPTDEAFADLPEGMVEQLLLPENKAVLIQILTYHVVPGAVLSTDLETGSVATVEGSDLAIEVAEKVTVNNVEVVQADIAASNGIIHVIDHVIVPLAPEADADIDGTEAIQ